MKVIIVGNGLDIFFGLKTSFSSYARWLEENEVEKWQLINEYWSFSKNSEWNEIEIKIYEVYKTKPDANKLRKNIIVFKKYFVQYLRERVIPNINIDLFCQQLINTEKIKELFKDSVIFSFNYTLTIETLLDCEHIHHIHGVIGDEKFCEDICIGYDIFTNKVSDERNPRTFIGFASTPERMIEAARENMNVQFKYYVDKGTQLSTFPEKEKNQYWQARKNNYKTFDVECSDFSQYDEMIIFGHSLGPADYHLIDQISKFTGNIVIIDYWGTKEEKSHKELAIAEKIDRKFIIVHSDEYKL